MNELLRKMLFLPPQASEHARAVDHLHYFIIITTIVAAFGVFLTTLVFVVKYRQRSPHDVTPTVKPRWYHEVLFIGVPLSLFLLWFAIGFPQYVDVQRPPKGAMDVYVQGKKWMWKFAYPGGPSSLDTLRVPAGRPVRLLITSRDVIHSFFVPALRVKQDALPGRYTQTWFQADHPGRYEIFCTQYCGIGHSSMLGELVVMPPAEFDDWMARQKQGLAQSQDSSTVAGEAVRPASSLADEGRLVAEQQGCMKCHSVDGTRHIGPTWLDLYGRKEKLSDGRTVIADEGYLTKSMMDPGADIVAGYQNVMPTYQGRLTPPQVAAILEFMKSIHEPGVESGPSAPPAYESIPRK